MIKTKTKTKIMKTIIKSNRTFGVEIEFNSSVSQTTVANILNNKFRSIEFKGEGYNHATVPYWKIITDSSVSDRLGYGLEIVSPILKGKKGLKEVQRILDVMDNNENFEVDITCGIHVHVDVNNQSAQEIANCVKLYAKQSEYIDAILQPSRRAGGSKGERWARNAYNRMNIEAGNNERLFNEIDSCLENRGNTTLSQINELCSYMGGRYNAVNLNAYRKYGTVEYRQHGGSLSAEKVCNWIVFVTNLTDRACKARKIFKTETSFVKTFGCSKQLKKFASNRAVHFGFNQFEIVEDEIVRVSGKDLAEGVELVKLSNGSFQLFANGNLLDNTMSHLKQFAIALGIDFEGMNTRRLGQALLSA
jgi:hypothetical protein